MAKRAQSTALAVTGGGRKSGPSVEKLPELERLTIPAALMLAADSVSERKEGKRPMLEGVYLHQHEGKGRIVGTDGARLFVASFTLPTPVPAWLEEGLIISNQGLKARVAMIAKTAGEAGRVMVTYAAGLPRATLSDIGQSMAFQVGLQTGAFPDYHRFLPSAAFGVLDETGEAIGKEWEPVGINSAYLKLVGELAKVLDNGLPKESRSKTGMLVRAFTAGAAEKGVPLVFDFDSWPGAVLAMLPARIATKAIAADTAAILAPAVKQTIAALRAHATRNRAWAETASSEAEKAVFLAKADGFDIRIADVLKRAPGVSAPAIEAPAEDPAPDPEPAAESSEWADPEPEDEDTIAA